MDDSSAPSESDETIAGTLAERSRPAEVAPELAPQIARFAILRKVGQGGMGVVYAGYDERLDRKVAIKLLRHRTGDAARRRLAREARRSRACPIPTSCRSTKSANTRTRPSSRWSSSRARRSAPGPRPRRAAGPSCSRSCSTPGAGSRPPTARV